MDSNHNTSEQSESEVLDLRRQLARLTAELDARTQAIDELTTSRNRFRELVESTSDWMWEVDLDGRYTYASPRVTDMLGLQPDDLIGTTPFELMPPDEAERLAAIFQRFASLAEPFERMENVFLDADGREIVIETSGVPVRGPDGEFQGYRGVYRNITERKQAEDAIREERKRAQTYLDLAGVIFVAMDAEGTINLVNRKACEVLGYAEDELVGKNWFDTCLPLRLRETVKKISKQLLSGELEPTEYYENPVITKDGEERIIAWHNTVMRDDHGAITGHLSSGADITERKQAAEALRASEDKYRTLVSHAPAVLWTADQNGCTSFVSSNIEQVYGYTQTEILDNDGSLWFGTIHTEDLATVEAAYDALIESGAPFDIEYRVQRKDGQWIWLHDKATRSYEAGGVLRVRGVFVDVTDRKRAEEERDRLEEQLRQAQKMEAIGQLAGGIAHDFNNILTAILGNAELLKMDLPETGEHSGFAGEIIRGARRAADLTGQLLAFARKGKWQVALVDIHDVVTQTVNMLAHTIDKRIEIRLKLDASPSTVTGDSTQLHSMLLNLGVNARDAMPDGGVLTFATRNTVLTQADCDEHPYELTPGDFLEISITDTGVGMDEQTQSRIFEPFFTTKEMGKGTGLGLAGAYGCVRSHDGSISVSSEPGRGAEFQITLPLSDDTGAALPDRIVASSELLRGSGHVLVVDDEDGVRNLLRISLQNLGYTVSECNDGVACVDYYRQHHREIDLVILDLIMPVMNGRDAFREIRKINPNVKVLVASGFSHSEATRGILDEGALELLSKPFQITELSQAVAKHTQPS